MRHMDVAAGILWRGERFLAALRPPDRVQGGWWEFPGGKVEAFETPQTALARELREELGVTVDAETCVFWRVLEHSYANPLRLVRLHFFHVRRFSGEPYSREGQTLRWVTPEEAGTLSFLAADAPVAAALRTGARQGRLSAKRCLSASLEQANPQCDIF